MKRYFSGIAFLFLSAGSFYSMDNNMEEEHVEAPEEVLLREIDNVYRPFMQEQHNQLNENYIELNNIINRLHEGLNERSRVLDNVKPELENCHRCIGNSVNAYDEYEQYWSQKHEEARLKHERDQHILRWIAGSAIGISVVWIVLYHLLKKSVSENNEEAI
jgi:hypothetical protein